MDAEFKEGDEVYYKQYIGELELQKKYKIVKVRQIEVPEDIKRLSKPRTNKALYGKEIEEIAKPDLYFVIEPLNGGEIITARQGELELV